MNVANVPGTGKEGFYYIPGGAKGHLPDPYAGLNESTERFCNLRNTGEEGRQAR
jgi:hypothetical protein